MIRKAERKDMSAVIALRMMLIKEANHLEDGEELTELEKNVTCYIKENLGTAFHVWVIEEDGEIVASSGLNFITKPPTYTNKSGKEAFIMNIYVLPAYRGRGYATALVKTILDFLSATDCQKVSLVATEAGRYVYEKIGFKIKPSVMEYSL